MEKTLDFNFIDKYILEQCINSLLLWNLFYIDLYNLYCSDIDGCEIKKEEFNKRLFHLIWLSYIDFEPMNLSFTEIETHFNANKLDIKEILLKTWDKYIINKANYYKYFLNGKITANWIKRFEELKEIIESNKWIRWFFNKIKDFFEQIFSYKYVVWIWLTWICLILIFWFNVKVSEYISKLPILSSIIDTETLEQFEAVNEDDDFYKWVMQEFESINSSDSVVNSEDKDSSVKIVEKIDPTILKDMKVRKVNENERIFRVKWADWVEQFITVKKLANGKLQVELPPKLKAIQEKIRNNVLRIRQ